MRRDPEDVPRPAAGAVTPDAVPDLAFSVTDAGVVEFAAVPTLRFGLRVECGGGGAVRSVALNVQLWIAAPLRAYDASARRRLAELFGGPEQWDAGLRRLLWTQASVVVPPFDGETTVALPVTCTYDFEVAAAKYLDGLEDGEVPLEFLFSGSVFYEDGAGRLRTARVPWEKEARYRLPVRTWRDAMDRHFPGSAWIRLEKPAFDRLNAYRTREALPSWEAALDALLESAGAGG